MSNKIEQKLDRLLDVIGEIKTTQSIFGERQVNSSKDIEQIRIVLEKQNGRIGKLEEYRWKLVGALGVGTAVVSGMVSYVVNKLKSGL